MNNIIFDSDDELNEKEVFGTMFTVASLMTCASAEESHGMRGRILSCLRRIVFVAHRCCVSVFLFLLNSL